MMGHVNDDAVKTQCGEISKSAESCISQWKLQNLEFNCKLRTIHVEFTISDFGSEMQDSSNFEICGMAL
jgi:hypothetical protein